MLNNSEVYKSVADETRFTEFGDGYVYFHDNKPVFLNKTARITVELCDGERCVADIANEIKDMFSLPHAPLNDTDQCIKSLRASGLVIPCGHVGDFDTGQGYLSSSPTVQSKAGAKSSVLRSRLSRFLGRRKKSSPDEMHNVESWLVSSAAIAVQALNDEIKEFRELTQREFSDLRSRIHVSGARILAEGNELAPVYLQQEFKYPVFNPTVVPTFDGFSFIARCSANVSYAEYERRGFNNTFNVIYRYDRNLNSIDSEVIDDPLVWAEHKDAQCGFQDARAFVWRGETWLVAAGMSFDEQGEWTSCQLLLKLDRNKITQCEILHSPFGLPRERNWVPLVKDDRLFLVYSFVPTTIFEVMSDFSLSAVRTSIQSYQHDDCYGGGTPLVPFDNMYLGLVHDKRVIFNEKKFYTHRFVLVDADFNLVEISSPFFIQRKGIEFAVGLARYENSFILSYGVADRAAAFVLLTEKTVRKWLVEGKGMALDKKRDDTSPVKTFVGRLGTNITTDPSSP